MHGCQSSSQFLKHETRRIPTLPKNPLSPEWREGTLKGWYHCLLASLWNKNISKGFKPKPVNHDPKAPTYPGMKIHMITLECLHTLLEMVQVAEYQSVPEFNQMSEGNAQRNSQFTVIYMYTTLTLSKNNCIQTLVIS